MISVFTPSHNPLWLDQCHESLRTQTLWDWEWIVLLNGDAEWECDDPQVRIYRFPRSGTVGLMKAVACTHASGSILVELDHDDVLLPDALMEIDRAFSENPTATLVYSDFAQMFEDGTPDESDFDLRNGWESTPEYYEGQTYKRWRAPKPWPVNVGLIWFAPNHIRAFRTSTYHEVGGYDPNRRVLDDQDLMMRLYMRGPFIHIDRLLYLVRVHDGNTQKDPELNAQIQWETVQMYCQQREALHLAYMSHNGLIQLQ